MKKQKTTEEVKRFFIGIAVLCLFLTLLILVMMLKPYFTGNVVYSGSEVVAIDNSTAHVLAGDSGQNAYLQENFFKHFIRVVLESFDDFLSF